MVVKSLKKNVYKKNKRERENIEKKECSQIYKRDKENDWVLKNEWFTRF